MSRGLRKLTSKTNLPSSTSRLSYSSCSSLSSHKTTFSSKIQTLHQISSVRSKGLTALKTSSSPVVRGHVMPRSFSTISSLSAPKKYTEAHEWIEVSEDGSEGTIGISEYAAKALGDVVYVELPTKDLEVNDGDAIGAVESVKSASDIYSPVAGTIIESNPLLEEKPGTINAGPEAEGWIAKIKIGEGQSDKLAELMDADAYAQHTAEE